MTLCSVEESDYTQNDIQRYLDKKIVTNENCWVLPLNKSVSGYTQFSKNGKRRMAHRIMWTITNGPIRKKMDIDHICHNIALANGTCEGGKCRHRACFNPEHLREVTRSENVKSGSLGVWMTTTCKNGHERTESNTRYTKNGGSFCWPCHMERHLVYKREWRKRRKELMLGANTDVRSNI